MSTHTHTLQKALEEATKHHNDYVCTMKAQAEHEAEETAKLKASYEERCSKVITSNPCM